MKAPTMMHMMKYPPEYIAIGTTKSKPKSKLSYVDCSTDELLCKVGPETPSHGMLHKDRASEERYHQSGPPRFQHLYD
jgi:hypothetical protein